MPTCEARADVAELLRLSQAGPEDWKRAVQGTGVVGDHWE